MGHKVDGEIKRSNAGHRPDGKTAHDAPAARGVFLPVERDELPVNTGAFFSGDIEGEDGTFDFRASRLNGLARLLRERAREFLFALNQERGDLTQDALSLEGRKTARGSERLDGGCDGSLGMLLAPLRNPGDQ